MKVIEGITPSRQRKPPRYTSNTRTYKKAQTEACSLAVSIPISIISIDHHDFLQISVPIPIDPDFTYTHVPKPRPRPSHLTTSLTHSFNHSFVLSFIPSPSLFILGLGLGYLPYPSSRSTSRLTDATKWTCSCDLSGGPSHHTLPFTGFPQLSQFTGLRSTLGREWASC